MHNARDLAGIGEGWIHVGIDKRNMPVRTDDEFVTPNQLGEKRKLLPRKLDCCVHILILSVGDQISMVARKNKGI